LRDGDVIQYDGVACVWRNVQRSAFSPVAEIVGATTGAAAVFGMELVAGEDTIDLAAGNAMLEGVLGKYTVLLADLRELTDVVNEILDALIEAGVLEDKV